MTEESACLDFRLLTSTDNIVDTLGLMGHRPYHSPYLSMRSSSGPVTASGRIGTTILLGQTIMSASVSLRKGSRNRRTALAV